MLCLELVLLPSNDPKECINTKSEALNNFYDPVPFAILYFVVKI